MTLPGFTAPIRTRWMGSREIELFEGPRHCRRCSQGEVVRVGRFTQHALFYFGGYGAGEAVDVNVCLACGHASRGNVTTVRPPRRRSDKEVGR